MFHCVEKCLILFTSIWVMLCPCRCANSIDENERPVIEKLIISYLEAEENVWQLLKNKDSNVLEEIYNVHKLFLNKSLSETEFGMFKNKVVPNNYTAHTSVLLVNLTAEFYYAHFESKEEFFNADLMNPYANYTKEKNINC